MPKYSIIIPVFNVERYLADCLDSVLAQSFGDYEIILINDGSTDGSRAICERYVDTYKSKEIRLINQENKGLLAARRTGIRFASGRYIWHVDSDDVIRKDALSQIDTAFKRYSVDLVVFEYSFKREMNQLRNSVAFDESRRFGLDDKTQLIEAYCKGHLNSMINKVVLAEHAHSDVDYSRYDGLNSAEDQLQVLDILETISTAYYIREPLYWYRQSQTSITANYTGKEFYECDVVLDAQLHRAASWEIEYGIAGLESSLITKALTDRFYMARRKVHHSNFEAVYSSLLDSIPEKAEMLGCVKQLRIDIRLFYKLIMNRKFLLAYLMCIAHKNGAKCLFSKL